MQATATEQSAGPLLVIDDSSTIRRSAEIFLGQAGYRVVLADDGFAALSVILEQRPALVFCDIQMPRLDGFQTCALIRRHPEFRSLPVVLLTSRDGVLDRARGVLAGATVYLTKPFTKDSLLRTVREQLAAASSQPPSSLPSLPATSSPSPSTSSLSSPVLSSSLLSPRLPMTPPLASASPSTSPLP